MAEDRRYNEREVGQILKRVTELHEHEGEKHDARAMTRGELEEVVTELGISRALVARAVSELATQDRRNSPVWWLGGKAALMFEEVVDGAIDEATLTQMLEVLRRSLGDPGELKREGAARIWSATQRRVHFSVVEHAGKTTLRLEDAMPEARATVGIVAFAGGFSGFMMMVPLKALLIKSLLLLMMGPLVAVGTALGWFAGRHLWGRQSVDRESELRRAFAEILALARDRARQLPGADPAAP